MKNLRTIMKAGVAGLGLAAIVVSTLDIFAEGRRIKYSYPEEQKIANVVNQLVGIDGYYLTVNPVAREKFGKLKREYETYMSSPDFRKSYTKYQKALERNYSCSEHWGLWFGTFALPIGISALIYRKKEENGNDADTPISLKK